MGVSRPDSQTGWFAARTVVAVALACAFATTPADAQSQIRISEAFFACANGDTTLQFVELENVGPDTVFTSQLRLQYLRDPDTGQFLVSVGSSIAGQPWPHGGHYLVGSSAFNSRLGIAPDFTSSSIRLSRFGGILRVYSLGGFTSIILDEIRYGPFGTDVAPPNGYSLGRVSGIRLTVQPSPQTRDGSSAVDLGCFGPALPGDCAITELMLQCRSGLPSGQFIEIGSVGGTRQMTSDVGIRYFDRTEQMLADIPGVFAGATGGTLNTARAWLLAPQGSSFLGNPDATFAVPMDTTAGRVVLYRARAGGDSILTDLRYGPSGSVPRPPPGSSLARDGVSGAYAIDPVPSPLDLAGHVRSLALDCTGPPVSSARIRQFQVRCEEGNPEGRFLELQSTDVVDQLDPTLSVAIYDHVGALIGEETGLFGARAGIAWPTASHWLLATAVFTDIAGRAADGPLGDLLDPVGGRIELRARQHADNAVVVVDAVTYGTPETPAPPPGQSLVRATGGRFVVSATPDPHGFTGTLYVPAESCRRPAVSAARISELQVRCADGAPAGRFVELEPARLPDTLDSTLALLVYDHTGALIGEQGDLFGARTGASWPSGRHWLLATDVFADSLGRAADTPLPLVPDTLGGRFELRARSRVDGSLAIVDAVSYGTGGVPAPPPGQSLARTSTGAFVVAAHPGAQGFSGAGYRAALGCRRPRVSSVRIAELGLRCLSGSTVYQFIELAPDLAEDELEPGLTLRAFDANHILLGEIADVFGASAGQGFPGAGPWFVGSAPWRTVLGAGPEAVLPFTLDRARGTIELAGHDHLTGEPVLLQMLEYGTPAAPAPAPGQSLVRSAGGGYVLAASTPMGSAGRAYQPDPACSQQGIASAYVKEFSLACASGSVAGQFIDIDLAASDDFIDSSLVVQAYDHADHLLGTIHVLADSRFPGRVDHHRSFATRFWQYDLGYADPFDDTYLNDALLPFVLDPAAGRIVLAARDRTFGDPLIVEDLRYGPGGVPAPASGTSLVLSPQGPLFTSMYPSPRPTWYGGGRIWNRGCEPARLNEVFTACGDGAPGVSYVALTAHTSYPYWATQDPLNGNELRAWGADGALIASDTVFVSATATAPLNGRSYLATSPAFATALGAAGDRALPGALDPSGGRVALGWTTPAGTFDVFDMLVYGPGGTPAPPAGRALARDTGSTWKDATPLPVTFDGRTFKNASCLGSGAWTVTLDEVFPGCRCGNDVSFLEFATHAEASVLERGLALVALDRIGVERWRMSDMFSSRAGQLWPAGQAYLLATPAARGGVLGGAAPDGVLPGSLDPDGGSVLVIRAAGSALPETLAIFAYGAGTTNPRARLGWSFQRQADGSYPQGFPSPRLFGAPAPLFGPGAASDCVGTGAFATMEQVLWSCTDGASGVSYIDFSSKLAGFPDDMGVRVFGRDGNQLFRLEQPFPRGLCGASSSHWLLASGAFEQLVGGNADGRMPVALDAVAGRVETFLLTASGDSVVQVYSYGHPGEPPITPGHAAALVPSPHTADARPIRADGRVLRAPGCIEDGAPAMTIAELLLRCGDSGTDAQYVRLEGGNDPDFHDSRLRLIALDRNGSERFHLDPLAPALEGRPVPAHAGLLLGGASLASRTGLSPDAVLPLPLDAAGGTLRLEWVRAAGAPPLVLDEVHYGPDTPLPLPTAGMALRPHDPVRAALHYLALPFNLAGERPASRACFADSCSAFSLNGHLAYPDSIRGTLQDCAYSSSCLITSYDWTQLKVSSYASAKYSGSSTVTADDDFVAEGLPLGTPISFKVRFDADLYGSYYPGCSDPFCRDAYASAATAGFSVAGVREQLPTVEWSLDTTITRTVTVLSGEPFRLSLAASSSAQTEDGVGGASGSAQGRLVPLDLPSGVVLRSCWGYVTPGVVAADVSLVSASATRDVVRLEWRTSLGSAFSARAERRTNDSPWLPLATVLPDGLGAIKIEDKDVHAGQTYDYRLHWNDGRGERTSQVVTLRVPDTPSFAFLGAYPNPVRDAFSLSIVLEDAGPARLEIFDVNGRRVDAHSLVLEPGEHVVPIPVGNRLPPGIYSLKLRQGAHAATRRLVVLP
jgi:hypothetical protein